MEQHPEVDNSALAEHVYSDDYVYDTDLEPGEVGRLLENAARALNYATMPSRLRFPSDIHAVAGNLAGVAGKMPQALEQMADWLGRYQLAGKVSRDDAGSPDLDVIEAGELLGVARAAAWGLHKTLSRLQSAVAHLRGEPL